jgi:hypothetical protein
LPGNKLGGEMKRITEEMGAHKEWYEKARSTDITMETLPKFLNSLLDDYKHDYGTIVHAMTAGAIATITAMNSTKQGGITGFQASCLSWLFLREGMGKEGALRLIEFNDLLYPQHEDRFEKTINKEIWADLQKKAAHCIKNASIATHPDVLAHWQSIVDGKLPFGFSVKKINLGEL